MGHKFHQDFLVNIGRVLSRKKQSFNTERKSEGTLGERQKPSWSGKRAGNLEVGQIKQKGTKQEFGVANLSHSDKLD